MTTVRMILAGAICLTSGLLVVSCAPDSPVSPNTSSQIGVPIEYDPSEIHGEAAYFVELINSLAGDSSFPLTKPVAQRDRTIDWAFNLGWGKKKVGVHLFTREDQRLPGTASTGRTLTLDLKPEKRSPVIWRSAVFAVEGTTPSPRRLMAYTSSVPDTVLTSGTITTTNDLVRFVGVVILAVAAGYVVAELLPVLVGIVVGALVFLALI